MDESEQLNCVDKLKVLANTTRLSVLELLMSGPKHVGEMTALLGLEQSLLSHHLQVLRQFRFVVQERDGKAVLYSLAPEVKMMSGKSLNLDCCVLSFEGGKRW